MKPTPVEPGKPDPFLNGVQVAWDAHSLKLAEECPRKYYYRMIEGWQSPSTSYHLTFGLHFATALERYYRLRAGGADLDEALETVVRQTLIDTAGWESGDSAKNRPNLIRTFVWYVEEFKSEEMKVITLPNGRPAVEYTFALEVDNDLLFCGHVDRLVEWTGSPYLMDQKTTGSIITPRFFQQFSPDIQMSMYTWAGRIIYNIPVKGVIIDGAQIAVGFSRFERGFTFRSDDQLEEWYDEMLALIELTQRYTRENFFPMRTSACGNYGGCPFRTACQRSPQVRKQFLEAEFVRGPIWNPLETR